VVLLQALPFGLFSARALCFFIRLPLCGLRRGRRRVRGGAPLAECGVSIARLPLRGFELGAGVAGGLPRRRCLIVQSLKSVKNEASDRRQLKVALVALVSCYAVPTAAPLPAGILHGGLPATPPIPAL